MSLLSALARLDLDPWREAAELSRLPRASAAARLADVLGKLPGSAPYPERASLSRRSVDLLPPAPRGGPAGEALAILSAREVESAAGRRHPLTILLMAVSIAVLLLMTYLDLPPSRRAGGPRAPDAATTSPGAGSAGVRR